MTAPLTEEEIAELRRVLDNARAWGVLWKAALGLGGIVTATVGAYAAWRGIK